MGLFKRYKTANSLFFYLKLPTNKLKEKLFIFYQNRKLGVLELHNPIYWIFPYFYSISNVLIYSRREFHEVYFD